MKEENIKDNAANDIVIEEAFARLDEINARLESPDTSLKDAIALYSEGVKLAAACRENLEGVEKEIKILNEV
jgi:exodeoxyribonuclease VII small subunit